MGLTMFESTGLFLAWIACTYFIAQITLGVLDGLKDIDEDLKTKIHKRLDDIIHRVKAEQQGDVTYWYDVDDGEFLAQGRSQEEIIQVVKSRYPNHLFYLPEENCVISKPTWEPKPVAVKPDA